MDLFAKNADVVTLGLVVLGVFGRQIVDLVRRLSAKAFVGAVKAIKFTFQSVLYTVYHCVFAVMNRRTPGSVVREAAESADRANLQRLQERRLRRLGRKPGTSTVVVKRSTATEPVVLDNPDH